MTQGFVHYLERVEADTPPSSTTYRTVCRVVLSSSDAGVMRWDMVTCDWCNREYNLERLNASAKMGA